MRKLSASAWILTWTSNILGLERQQAEGNEKWLPVLRDLRIVKELTVGICT